MANQGELLQHWLDSKRWSALDLARELGVSKQNVYYHLKRQTISPDFIERMVKQGFDFLGTDRSNIVSEPKPQYKPGRETTDNIMWVPHVTIPAYAGYLSGYGDQEWIDDLPTIAFPKDRERKGQYRAFTVRGDSMSTEHRSSIEEGDIVLGRQVGYQHWKHKLHIDKYIFVIVHRVEGILIKKISRHDVAKGTITLHSFNPTYPDQQISLNDVGQLYNIVKIMHNMEYDELD